ncbi:MAG: hypothetical protein DWQ34_25900 [Planctomycetota bacterium]|nr:MAG: hypothetical protein DWQ34_25900 [Planctomycetota bacterium]
MHRGLEDGPKTLNWDWATEGRFPQFGEGGAERSNRKGLVQIFVRTEGNNRLQDGPAASWRDGEDERAQSRGLDDGCARF